jgi:hypothetical protein
MYVYCAGGRGTHKGIELRGFLLKPTVKTKIAFFFHLVYSTSCVRSMPGRGRGRGRFETD